MSKSPTSTAVHHSAYSHIFPFGLGSSFTHQTQPIDWIGLFLIWCGVVYLIVLNLSNQTIYIHGCTPPVEWPHDHALYYLICVIPPYRLLVINWFGVCVFFFTQPYPPSYWSLSRAPMSCFICLFGIGNDALFYLCWGPFCSALWWKHLSFMVLCIILNRDRHGRASHCGSCWFGHPFLVYLYRHCRLYLDAPGLHQYLEDYLAHWPTMASWCVGLLCLRVLWFPWGF